MPCVTAPQNAPSFYGSSGLRGWPVVLVCQPSSPPASDDVNHHVRNDIGTESRAVPQSGGGLSGQFLVCSLLESSQKNAVLFTHHGSQVVGIVVTIGTLTWPNQHREEISTKSVSVGTRECWGIDHLWRVIGAQMKPPTSNL